MSMVEIHLPQPFFVISNQCVTQRSGLRVLLHFVPHTSLEWQAQRSLIEHTPRERKLNQGFPRGDLAYSGRARKAHFRQRTTCTSTRGRHQPGNFRHRGSAGVRGNAPTGQGTAMKGSLMNLFPNKKNGRPRFTESLHRSRNAMELG